MNSSKPDSPSSTPTTESPSQAKNSTSSNPYWPQPGEIWIGVMETGFLERIRIMGVIPLPGTNHAFVVFNMPELFSYKPVAFHLDVFLSLYSPLSALESPECATTQPGSLSSKISSLKARFSSTTLAAKWQNLASRAKQFW